MNLPGTNLVLHATPWHSYSVEQRNTLSPLNPWMFLKHVPLTNDFQVIAPRAAADTEFRASEFVADPFLFELTVRPDDVLPTLYGPANQTSEIETTTNLAPPVLWEPYETVLLTNSFRIFAPETRHTPQRYFKINGI